jgi:hypothetical protein
METINQFLPTRNELANAAMLVSYLEGDGQYTQPLGEGVFFPAAADGTQRAVAAAQLVEVLLAEAENAADGRRRIPAGFRPARYLQGAFWRRDRSEHAEAS